MLLVTIILTNCVYHINGRDFYYTTSLYYVTTTNPHKTFFFFKKQIMGAISLSVRPQFFYLFQISLSYFVIEAFYILF